MYIDMIMNTHRGCSARYTGGDTVLGTVLGRANFVVECEVVRDGESLKFLCNFYSTLQLKS